MRTRLARHNDAQAKRTPHEPDQLLDATEKIQNALLDSVAQDLRTPLVSIQGALSCLQEEPPALDRAARQTLIDNAADEANRLNYFIGNLLDMARVEAGEMRIDLEPYDLDYVIGSALARLNKLLNDRSVRVHVPSRLPAVLMDYGLMVKVFAHLLDNAAKYSPPGTPIDVEVCRVEAQLETSIADRGPGIPADDLSRVFDKFYRVPRGSSVLGTGLGLAISKGIVEAHGGRITAENRRGGGAVMKVILPLASRSRRNWGNRI